MRLARKNMSFLELLLFFFGSLTGNTREHTKYIHAKGTLVDLHFKFMHYQHNPITTELSFGCQ